MIKNNVKYAATMALMVSSMAFATTSNLPASGTSATTSNLPASRVEANQSGRDSFANPTYKLPGVVGTQETPTAGISSKGETPATGVQSGQKGSASMDVDALPGTNTSAYAGSVTGY